MPLTYTTQAQVRRAFWEDHPQFKRRFVEVGPDRYRQATQNDYPTDIRSAFVDYVDSLQRAGMISERLAERVTL